MQHRYHACPQEFANSAQRMNKTEEVIKVRRGRRRVQKTTAWYTWGGLIVSSGCKFISKRERLCFCKGEEFLVRKVNMDIIWRYYISYTWIVLDTSSLVMSSSSYVPWSTHGLIFWEKGWSCPHHVMVKDSFMLSDHPWWIAFGGFL